MADEKNKNYIDKEDMMNELKLSHEKGRPTERLGEMFMLLCEKYSHNHMFRDYERRYGRAFKEDLLSSGLVACSRAWDKFDLEKYDNPFSFFTTCIFRAYIGFLSKEYNYGNTKNALKVDVGMRGDYGYEEMIENSKVQDEENTEFDNVTVGYEVDEETETDEFGIETSEKETSKSDEDPEPEPKKKVSNPALERMRLWEDDEELPEEPEDDNLKKIDYLFGIGALK